MKPRKDILNKRIYSEKTGKLHMLCPYKEKSGVCTHVVIKENICYRSSDCMVLECRFHAKYGDIDTILSVAW